jgi:hypothetical protein
MARRPSKAERRTMKLDFAAKVAAAEHAFEPTVGEAEIRASWAHTLWAELGTGVLCLATVLFWPLWSDGWAAAAVVEAALTMATLTLTDIATRLRKPPSILVGILIAAGVGLLYVGEVNFAFQASSGTGGPGWLGPILAIWAISQRGRAVWHMPRGDALDRMRHRALVGDRAVVAGILVVVFLAIVEFGQYFLPEAWVPVDALVALAVAYALLALFTAARIPSLLGAKFAAKPKSWFFDLLGVDYLARL